MSHTLLLADPNRTIHRVIELTFADQPVHVVGVTDGAAAIARLDSEPPDLVLADVTMAGADGYEVCRHVKQSPRLAHIPVVLLTGAFEPVDEARARAVRCDGVLAKPFDPQIVVRRVRELLARATARPPEPENAPPPATPAPAAAPAATPVAALDDYFAQLDASLSALASGPVPAAPDVIEAPAFEVAFVPPAPSDSPAIAFDAVAPAPEESKAGRSMADAFVALLDAERRSAGGPGGPGLVVDEALIEEIVARVMRRLADQGVRHVVADIVSQVAERMVREEIVRLKTSLS
ncbi:MAG TPA: response regulator [Vicinamibacterales bacterium]|nr:response regulator [Vicinamibacterales bacterium]